VLPASFTTGAYWNEDNLALLDEALQEDHEEEVAMSLGIPRYIGQSFQGGRGYYLKVFLRSS